MSDTDIRRVIEAVKREIEGPVSGEAVSKALDSVAVSAKPTESETAPEPESPAVPPRKPPDPVRPAVTPHPSLAEGGEQDGSRIIVAAFGRNRPGVAAALTGILAECRCDIADITQKILQEFFSIIMIVDIRNATVDFATLREKLKEIEAQLGITIVAQHQDVFRAMHRV